MNSALALLFFLSMVPRSTAPPRIQSVVNAASYSTNLAPGTLASIFGTQLAPATATAASHALPTVLNGVSVLINGTAAPLLYVSPAQVNVFIPDQVASLGPSQQISVPVVVKTASGSSAGFSIKLGRNAPAIFTQNGTGIGNALAFDGNFHPVSNYDGGPILQYATGLGPTLTDSSAADIVNVFIGDMPAKVLSAGLAPGLPGVYQIKALPQAPITNHVYLAMYTQVSNMATLRVPVGTNVAHVTGSIDGLYPASGAAAVAFGGKSTGGPVSFSAMLAAGTFSTAFDIVPGAKPFQIVARAWDNGTIVGKAVIDVQPANHTWTGTITVPTSAARAYDFSDLGVQVIDFETGRPFPGSIIPSSRVDVIAHAALQALPVPSTTAPAHSPNATYVNSGALPAGGHFSISPHTSSEVSNFGGFKFISRLPGLSVTTTFEVFVDGMLIASKDVSYQQIE